MAERVRHPTPSRRSRTSVAPLITARRSSVAEPGVYPADRVRSVRAGLHVSQTVFADLLGVSKSLVEHWERGVRPPSPTVRRLLDALRSHPESFLARVTTH